MTREEKIKKLREAIKNSDLDGFLVPRADEYQGEYVPAGAERLAWLTGFTGSAGIAVIIKDKAVVMTDGRYTIQVKQQVDAGQYETEDITQVSPAEWLAKNAEQGARIGYDPRLHTVAAIGDLQKKLKAKQIELVSAEQNPVDAIWQNRPGPPMDNVEIFPEKIAGKTATQKRTEISAAIKEAGADALILTLPDSIAWLLNIRGHDIPHTPVALSNAIVHGNGETDWFIPSAKIPHAVRQHLGQQVRIREPEELRGALEKLATKTVILDFRRSSLWFKMKLEESGALVEDGKDPCILPKACKTEAEQQAIIDAHVRDGVALARLLKWLDEEAPGGTLTERDVMEKLESFRRQDKNCRDLSFATIAGWAANGAIVHYHATPEKKAPIAPPGLLLLDSGAQYDSGGTTDVTRTISIGKPTAEMKERFTLVLKGHIAVAMALFPEGTNGAQIDDRARRALWDAGLDYDHGTGHGVGCYLSVHEEGTGISRRSTEPFKPGMLVSNEPGYYKEGAYGIRIESLLLVRENGLRKGTKTKMLAFETVTLAPIDRRIIVTEMLPDKERDWLNAYHNRVYKTLSPHLEDDVAAWLGKACAPL